jgi:hypothetical protein
MLKKHLGVEYNTKFRYAEFSIQLYPMLKKHLGVEYNTKFRYAEFSIQL